MSTGTSWQTVSRRNLKNRQSTFKSHSYQNENDNTILPLSTQFNTTFSLFTQLNTTFSFSLSPTQHFAFSLRQKNFSFSLRPTQPFAFSLSPKTFLFHSAQHNLLLRLKQFMLCVRASSRHKSFFFQWFASGTMRAVFRQMLLVPKERMEPMTMDFSRYFSSFFS